MKYNGCSDKKLTTKFIAWDPRYISLVFTVFFINSRIMQIIALLVVSIFITV